MSRATLTRAQAHALVEDCANVHEMAELAGAWGVEVSLLTADEAENALHEYVDACADTSDDVRSNGPHDADDTGLDEPVFAIEYGNIGQ